MGISEFREVKDTFIGQTSLKVIKDKVKNSTSVDVYVDGSFFLYTGFINENMGPNGKYQPELVAKTVSDVIHSNITKIKQMVPVGTVYIYFDGQKPFSKQKTMNLRRLKRPLYTNMTEIKNCIIESLNAHNYIMNNLVLGEAEHEMFNNRDKKRPSIMLTDDSDIFHITYDYETKTYNDYVFVATKGLKFTCNLNDLKSNFNNIPKSVFTLLCGLKGSDFTHDTITNSMLRIIISELQIKGSTMQIGDVIDDIFSYTKDYAKKERAVEDIISKCEVFVYNNIDEDAEFTTIEGIYSMEFVCICAKYLLTILRYTKKSYTMNRTQKCKSLEVESIYEQLKALTWYMNYSLIGCRYDKYFENAEYPTDLNVFVLYHFFLNYEGGDVYSTLKNMNFENVDRKSFMNTFKYKV